MTLRLNGYHCPHKPKLRKSSCGHEPRQENQVGSLTGRVCTDSLSTYQYSGIGGQMDFIKGSCLSEGGKPIIALPSVTSKGLSRIVPFLKEGAGVVTTRGHVHWVGTEYGIVNLFGKNLKQRAKELINIAHPAHKEFLEKAFYDRFKTGQ